MLLKSRLDCFPAFNFILHIVVESFGCMKRISAASVCMSNMPQHIAIVGDREAIRNCTWSWHNLLSPRHTAIWIRCVGLGLMVNNSTVIKVRQTQMRHSSHHWVREKMSFLTYLVISLFCLYGRSGGTYTEPMCEYMKGFYCLSTTTCLLRTLRCTGGDSDQPCIQKTDQGCRYDSTSGKFAVYRYSTGLSVFGSSSRSLLDCLQYELEHHFITYRGLMFEFGTYGTRVQDLNDPNYEYKTRSWYDEKSLGVSSCTYEQVIKFMDTWGEYKLCSNNCQDFASGLGNYLITDCQYPRKRNVRSANNSDLAEHIFSIAGNGNCTSTLSASGRPPTVPLQFFVFFAATLIGIFTIVF